MSKLKNIDIEDYWNIIKYNYSQIQFAEVKATAVISIYSLIFGLGYTLDILDEENVYSFNFDLGDAIHIILLGVSLFFVIALTTNIDPIYLAFCKNGKYLELFEIKALNPVIIVLSSLSILFPNPRLPTNLSSLFFSVLKKEN